MNTLFERTLPKWFCCSVALAGVCLLSACQPQVENPAVPPIGEHPSNPAIPGAISQRSDDEQWYACFINGKKVGYTHIETERRQREDGSPIVTTRYSDKLVMRRFNTTMVMKTHLQSTEDGEGRLLQFRSEMSSGPQPIVSRGNLKDGRMIIDTVTQGKTATQTIEWDDAWGGFFADRQSLRDKPMKPGEKRTIHAFLPVINQPGIVRLEADSYEATPLIDGAKQLLRINVTTVIKSSQGETELKSVLWADRDGRPAKSRDMTLKVDAIETTKEIALREDEAADFDLGFDTIVRVRQRLKTPHDTTKVLYTAKLRDGDASSLFSRGLSQQVEVGDDGSSLITVLAVRPDIPDGQVDPDERPDDASRKSTSMIQSDDERVVALAGIVGSPEEDPWKLACELEQFVHRKIRKKNYTTAIATAAEVAESLEGDCTEHAVLLAALCRARKIPARVAIGLVYYPAASGYAYHMWTEAWIKDRWIPLDATLGRGGIGAAHLKMADSNLQGSNAFAEMLPVIQAIGRLELEILDVEN